MKDEPQHLQPRMGPRYSRLRMSHTALAPVDGPHDACTCGLDPTALAPPREGGAARTFPARRQAGSRLHLHVKGDHNASMRPEPQRSAEPRTTTLAVRRPLLRAKGGTIKEWQNLLIMHDLSAPDGKRGPSGQDIREMYSPTAFFAVLSIHRKQILPKLADFACISVISCHEGAFSPSGALLGIHRDEILP